MATRIAYVTYSEHDPRQEPDLDLPVFTEIAESAGWIVDVVPWDTGWYDWSAPDAVLVRTPWDYVERYPEFLGWLARAGEVGYLLNPERVIADSTDKRYLRRLAGAGIPVAPTAWLEPGDPIDDETWLAEALAPLGGDGAPPPSGWVVKPHIGNRTGRAVRCPDPSAVQAAATPILEAGLIAMVQPYLEGIEDPGEIAIVVLGGEPAYAVRKGPGLGDGASRQHHEVELTGELQEFAAGVLGELIRSHHIDVADVIAARVDAVTVDGAWHVMEAQLAEPALFFEVVPDGASRLLEVVSSRVASRRVD